ncbi:bcl-2-related ovarian killer protein-like isoform X3 [Homarus americanus]|uniref:bcl-2-related ovarian killer protein-like isoform X3 n=1 Tax=Homarus americanus TaxID=6706 RepID=UPI001C4401C9|nr:bcl-2-related ovarian killer protein-like isoform X3 [Homarus americanus]
MSSGSLDGMNRVGVGVGMGGSVGVRLRKSSVPIVSPQSLEIPTGPLTQRSLSRSSSPARRRFSNVSDDLPNNSTRTPNMSSSSFARRRFSSVMDYRLNSSLKPNMSPSSFARRRFSNVSDVVTRKISTTIGWRSVNVEAVVTQAKCLVTQYIRSRLKRAGLLHKKLGLQRLRSVANLAGGWEVCEVFPRVSGIGQELERTYPKLYASVARQLSITLTSDKVVRSVMVQVAGHVFRAEVTWARIISLFAVAAGLASDCVKQGHPEYVAGVIEVVGLVTERHTAPWIASQGGWSSLLTWSQTPETEGSVLQVLVLVVVGLILAAFMIILALKFLGELVT